ncbi:hypothetical protein EVJ58_g776 [Rhodofomes roseus]|uniref:Glycosyltransferase family 1 protein n=1 Tax=Rhodofomes roseus TaxID=34475 RepID=A0A4Y9Z2T2_9APHY|nr:hypothetical protein EVJ58_g776 [Rhodofomes roseus]
MSEAESVPTGSHLVLFAYEAWGHARPLCNLAARLAQGAEGTTVTFLTTPAFYDRVNSELLRNFDADEPHPLDRIRVIALNNPGAHALDTEGLHEAFAEALEKLVKGLPLQCVHTGTTYNAVPRPKAVIIDAVRRLSGPDQPIKVFAWIAAAASIMFRMSAPERLGGIGDLLAKSAEEATLKQVEIAEAAGDIAYGTSGTVVNIPGLPPMYDYEIEPQTSMGGKALNGGLCLLTYQVLNACDGIIHASPECYEPGTIAALRQWMVETTRPLYCAGPMVALGTRAEDVEKQQSDNTAGIDDFLASTLSRYGERSLLYISFGTVYWPMEPEKIWAFLNAVLDLKIPFLISHASPYLNVPSGMADKVKQCGHGLLTKYTPQQHILHHPATGWFLTHCGHNSTIEAICAGVPMICWPFFFDQPLNSLHLTQNLGVAYELFNVRTGSGLRPVHRLGKAPEGTPDSVKEEAREVLSLAFGEDGKRKREKMQALQQKVLDARSKQGASTRDIQAFLGTL